MVRRDVLATVFSVKRGFWAHQLVEYLLGVAAIATGAQSPKPALPCIAGALMMLNAGSTHGPLAAFRLIPRKVHRLSDAGLIVLMAVGAAIGGSAIDSAGRSVLVALAIVLAFVSWRTSYETKPPMTMPTREEIGQLAGHVSGKAYKAVRDRTRSARQASGEATSRATSQAANAAGRVSAGALSALRNARVQRKQSGSS